MIKTEFLIKKMDCPSEENLIRMKLDGFEEIRHLDFDTGNRGMTVYHSGKLAEIEQSIPDLKLGGQLLGSKETEEQHFETEQLTMMT